MKRMAAAIVLLTAAILPGGAQSRVIVRGRVVSAATGDPIRNARVSLEPDRDLPATLSGPDGFFSLTASTAGRHTVQVIKPGFTKASIIVPASTDQLTVALIKGAVISGRVVDLGGEPAPAVTVMIEAPSRDGNRPALVKVVQTDDAGEYRAAGLAAGSYLVAQFA